MWACRTVALTVLGLALLWSAPASSDLSSLTADGWYKWQLEGMETTFFLKQENGRPAKLRYFSSDCRISWGGARTISGEVIDMGALSLDDSVTMLLDIAKEEDLNKDVRQAALFGLAQSDSDTAYAYFDQILFAQKR